MVPRHRRFVWAVILLALRCTAAGDRVFAFGNNADGELGTGDTTESDTPTLMASNDLWLSAPVTFLATGTAHTVVIAGGRVFTCGWNGYGQLGIGSTTSSPTPQALVGPNAPWASTPAVAVAAGRWHTLILAGGNVFACGWNAFGQLGLGTQPLQATSPTRLPNTTAWAAGAAAAIAGGEQHSVVLAADGAVWTFGDNGLGQLGLTAAVTTSPLPQRPVLPGGATRVAAGGSHTLVLVGGSLYVFGWNQYGQLGLGTAVTQYDAPQPLPLPFPGPVTRLAVGVRHTLVASGPDLYTCGDNTNGQLGLGTTGAPVTALKQLPNATWTSSDILAMAAGDSHSLVVAGGRVYAFGLSDNGALGLVGASSSVSSPQPLLGASQPWGLAPVTGVSAGAGFSVLSVGFVASPSPSPLPTPSPSPSPPPGPRPSNTAGFSPSSSSASAPQGASPAPSPSPPSRIAAGRTKAGFLPIVAGICTGGAVFLLLIGVAVAHLLWRRSKRLKRIQPHLVELPDG